MSTITATATVLNFDNYGSYWGASTVVEAEEEISVADANLVNEWNVINRNGQPLRIVRIADPEFLDTISVIPV